MADEEPLGLQHARQIIEKKGTARRHGDTLEKRGISVDDLLLQMTRNIPSCIFGKEKLMPLQAVMNSKSM